MSINYTCVTLGAAQNLTTGAASARIASPLGNGTIIVRLMATTDCYIKIGDSTVVADTTTSTYVAALIPEYIQVRPGQFIAAIQVALAGLLNITECSGG